MNPEKFVWTSEEYTCEELRDKFDNKFPVIALVTTGYYGEKEQEQIGTDTILRIHDWGVQQRVVAKDHRGRYVTLPTNYPLKVQQLLKTLEPVGKYMTIQEFLNNHILPKTAQLDKDEVQRLYTGDRIEMFGPLEIIHVYSEKFFKTNVFRGGTLAVDNTFIIPTHLGMRFKVALGMKASSADDWTQWLNGVNLVAQRVDFSSISGIPDIFVYKKEAAGLDFNTELPVYHVRHPLTLKKGMDRQSWNMCLITPRRETGWVKPAHDDNRPKFNQITGMKQPTLAPAVHSELLAKLGKGPKKQEMVTNPGDFASRHKMLEAIFAPSPKQTQREPVVRRQKSIQEKDNIYEQTDFPERREKSRNREVDTDVDYRQRPISGEYDVRLIPQEDNAVYGSHVPKPRDAQPQYGAGRSRENSMPDNRARQLKSKVGNPETYVYSSRELSPRRGEELRRERMERDRERERSARNGRYDAHQQRQQYQQREQQQQQQRYLQDRNYMVGDPHSYAYGGKRIPQRPIEDHLDPRGPIGFARGGPGQYRIGDLDHYSFSGPTGEYHHHSDTRSNRDDIESLWPTRKFPTDKFADMSPEQVAECLEELDMGEHVDRFLDVGVDGLILMSLTKEDLRRDFDVSGMQATRLLKFAREGWKT